MWNAIVAMLLTAAMFAPVPAMAQAGGGQAKQRPDGPSAETRDRWITEKYEQMDANGDGRITRAEFDETVRTWADKQFVRADKDQNGEVTRQEFDAVVQEMHKKKAERQGRPGKQ